ncbi:DNA primase [Mariprofundus erugo]|uniref:DNA primase n=1 Tax=Mariprofundus erugo TaxID=2528639 RepID=A0A5R9GSE2_9PROT|nr:DNA primase [Mariprofundus erugo]TLS68518.1 DNA primase [Mariprofundus erugo]
MANFSPTFLDEVLARSDLVELIQRHVELKRSGSNLMGLCPFHHEKSPSFSVSPDRQLYYCFGCGKGGGAFQFLMEHDGYSFPEAVEYLADKAGLELPRDTHASHTDDLRQQEDFRLLERAASAMAAALNTPAGANALLYLQKRLLPPAIVREYGLGYAPQGYGFMDKVFGTDAATHAKLERVGLLFKGDRGYGDRFRDRLMFPIRDRRGRVAGFGGRVLGEGEPKYLNSPETPYFHKSELLYGFFEHRDTIRKRRQLVVVEGYMDVLAMAAHGLKIGLAPLGTATSEGQIGEILRLCDTPVFCFDGDRAGRQAAWRALERMLPLLKSEFSPKFLYLPEGEDPDSLLNKEGAEAFSRRLEQDALPVLESWIYGLKLLAGQGAEGRAVMAKKADAMLAAMADPYLVQVWRQEAERVSGLALQSRGRPARVEAPKPVQRAAVVLNAVEERFMAGLLQEPARLERLSSAAMNFFIDKPTIHAIYSRAFSMRVDAEAKDTDIARQLIRAFPDDQQMISRWINQAAVHEIEYRSLLLDMETNDIRRRMRGGIGLGESVLLQKRLRELQQQQQELKEQLGTTGA